MIKKLYDATVKRVKEYTSLPKQFYMLSLAVYDLAYAVQQHNAAIQEISTLLSLEKTTATSSSIELPKIFKTDGKMN